MTNYVTLNLMCKFYRDSCANYTKIFKLKSQIFIAK